MQGIVFTDGASRGNPGAAGIGFVITAPDGTVLAEEGHFLGQATNNVAEYTALIRALERAAELGCRDITVYADSELMIKQLNGEYRVRNDGLIPLFQEVQRLKRNFSKITFGYVPRERNKRADQLANMGIDTGGIER